MLLLIGISLAAGVIEMIGPALAMGVAQGTADRVTFQALLGFAFVPAFFGDFLQLTRLAAGQLLDIYVIRAGLLAAILLGVRGRWSLAFYIALLGVVADLLLSAYLLVNNRAEGSAPLTIAAVAEMLD